jgi:alpha-N-arabinofuranosidase
VLRPVIDSPAYQAKTFDEIPYLCASVIDDETTGRTTIFALNRHLEEDMELKVELRGLGRDRVVEEALELFHSNMKAVNTKDSPNAVAPTYNADVSIDGETLTARLKPGSWNVLVTRTTQTS